MKKTIKKELPKKEAKIRLSKNEKIVKELTKSVLQSSSFANEVIKMGIKSDVVVTSLIMTAYREGINFSREYGLEKMSQEKTDSMILIDVVKEIKRLIAEK